MPEIDTVREKYYKPLEFSEVAGGWLFWMVSVLSIATLLFDKNEYIVVYDIFQASFIVCVLLFFIQGQVQRLYFFPRAEDKRREELLSNSYGVSISHETTVGYYNNNQTNPLKRLAASIMESAFFTREIVQKMLVTQRMKTGGYLIFYFIVVLNRSTNLEILAVAAQAVFSEDIIARWLRMEWLRVRSDHVFNSLNRLFLGKPSFSKLEVQSQAVELFSLYETTKSTAAVLLSSEVFRNNNGNLTAEWDRIRGKLSI